MKYQSLFSISSLSLLALASATSASSVAQEKTDTKTTFECQEKNGEFTTIARTITDRGTTVVTPVIRWHSHSFGPEWSPRERCHKIVERFQNYNEYDCLKFLSVDTRNEFQIIRINSPDSSKCKEKEQESKEDGLVLTVEPGVDPGEVLSDLWEIRVRARGLIMAQTLQSDTDERLNLPVSKPEGKLTIAWSNGVEVRA